MSDMLTEFVKYKTRLEAVGLSLPRRIRMTKYEWRTMVRSYLHVPDGTFTDPTAAGSPRRLMGIPVSLVSPEELEQKGRYVE